MTLNLFKWNDGVNQKGDYIFKLSTFPLVFNMTWVDKKLEEIECTI